MTETQWLYLAGFAFSSAVVLGGLTGIVLWFIRQQPREVPTAAPILDWRPTLRINMEADPEAMFAAEDDILANWVLRVEEGRVMAGVGGDAFAELRWRPATRREAANVARVYHQAMDEDIKKRAQALRLEPVAVRVAGVAETDQEEVDDRATDRRAIPPDDEQSGAGPR